MSGYLINSIHVTTMLLAYYKRIVHNIMYILFITNINIFFLNHPLINSDISFILNTYHTLFLS